MRHQIVRAALIVSVVGAVLTAGTAAAHASTSGSTHGGAVNLESMLTGDGRLAAGRAANVSVNFAGWQLTSNLAAGEAPRFGKATAASPSALEAAAWSALGSNNAGNGALNGYVLTMAFFDGDLYIGGGFQNVAGDPTADFIARWNGDTWSGVGSNGSGNGALNAAVRAFCVLEGKLLVGGAFTNAANVATADYLARWSGSAWSGMGSNGAGNGPFNDQVFAIATTGEDTYVGGMFTNASGNATADYGARWSGAAWVAVDGSTTTAPFASWVWSIAIYDQSVYFGGSFINGGGINEADWIVKWHGGWSALGNRGPGLGALNSTVMSIVANGSTIYAGGQFTNAAGLAKADYIARWDGSAWHSMGSNGAGGGALNDYVSDIALSNGYVYIAGTFTNAAGIAAADDLAVWKGSSWAALPANGGGAALNADGLALLIDNGTLYVGSSSQNTSGIATADFIAAFGPLTEPTIKPDGAIKKGSAGTYVGGNIYSASATNESLTAQKAAGTKATFYISIQNDGSVSDTFTLRDFWTTSAGISTRYYKGTTEITSKLAAGTYVTPTLSPGSSTTIKAVVTVGAGVSGAGTGHLIRIGSNKDASKVDAVRFSVTRL